MSDVTPVPEHLHTVTPRLIVSDAAAAIDFYKAAFGAEEIGERYHLADGRLVHAEIRIGDSVVMLSDSEGGDASDLSSALFATYWPEVDAAWARAIAAGADVIHPLADQFYGERSGRIGDPFGQQWSLSARIEQLTIGEIAARETAA